jgi:hypothetical protein
MRAAIAIGVLFGVHVGFGGVAGAQTASDDDRFFVDKIEEDGEEDETLWQGSLTSTSFLHREAAGISDPLSGGAVGIENAAPLRWFTDLRAQIDARHIGGKSWDARADVRARMINSLETETAGDNSPEPQPQSGSLSGNEYEIRDLYIVRGTTRTDTVLGRQTVLDVAAIKIDGLRIDYAKNQRWTYLGFIGLYPMRGSRSITTDYPRATDPATLMETGKRVMPVAGGFGAAYRTEKMYGAIGSAVIVPLADDVATGTLEEPRALVSSQGYWRQSPQLDLFHYAVLDVYGSAGVGTLTNGSLGVNYRPQPRLHVNAGFHHFDTETLHVQAQTELDPVDGRDVGAIQNNIRVARIAADSARLSVSAALGRTMRWEVTAAGAGRRRPQVNLDAGTGTDQLIPAAKSAEIFFQAVDRRFFGGVRAAASFARIFGVGENAARSTSQLVRVAASREFKEGRGEWEADVSYFGSVDENREACTTVDISTCYGSSQVRTISLNGTAFYRLKKDWFLMGSAAVGQQTLTTLDGGTTTKQPSILMTTGFVRIAYRF